MGLLDRSDFRYSFIDGMFANAFINLTTGAFLIGFSLYLEMSDFFIGVMLSIPYVVSLFQLPACYYIRKNGKIKRFTCLTATISRAMWIPILMIGFWPGINHFYRSLWVMLFFFISHAFGSVSNVSWLTWTSDLVPDELRGVFFGTRNAFCGAVGIITVLIFGNLVDFLKTNAHQELWAISLPFIIAIPLGLIGLQFLRHIGDSEACQDSRWTSWREMFSPFQESNFRNYLIFGFLWSFAIHFASPFFSLYFLRELHFSYGYIAFLTTTGALMDMVAMRFWGRISDKIKNKAIIQLAGWAAVFLPILWTLVRPHDLLMPVLLQILSGCFWAGVSLCTQNLLLGISPKIGRVWYISAYNIMTGLGAAIAPIVAGLILSILSMTDGSAGSHQRPPLHYIFLISTVLRFFSLMMIRWIKEPQEVRLNQIMRELYGVRSQNAPKNAPPAIIAPIAASMTPETSNSQRSANL